MSRTSRSSIDPFRGGPPAAADGSRACAYCGAGLDSRWYFCLRCATPWRDVEEVLTPARPLMLTAGQLIRTKAPVVWPLFWTYFCVVVGGSLIAYGLAGEEQPHVRMLILDGLLLVTTCVFAGWHGRSLAPQLSRSGFERWEAWVGLVALVPLLAVNWAYHRVLVEAMGIEASDPFDEMRSAGLSESTLVFVVAVFPAINEEIAFRGLVQHWLHVAVGPRTALVLAAALFAGLHLNVFSLPYLFLAGLLLGWVKQRTGSLYPSMAIHFAHNFVVLESSWF